MTSQKVRNLKVGRAIAKWLLANGLQSDTTIYYNGKAYSYDSAGKVSTRFVQPSTIFQYAEDDTVNMVFEGPLYEVLNFYHPRSIELHEQFMDLVDEWDFWYEKGNAWNLTLHNKEVVA